MYALSSSMLDAAAHADRTMYAVHPIPLSEVKAIRRHTPSFGWQYIVLVLVNGLTLPPLYFGTGGVRALFTALKQVCDTLLLHMKFSRWLRRDVHKCKIMHTVRMRWTLVVAILGNNSGPALGLSCLIRRFGSVFP